MAGCIDDMYTRRARSCISLIIWICGCLSILPLILYGDPSAYFMITAVMTHVSVPAPLGQLPPILDVTTNYFHVYSWLISPVAVLLGWWLNSICWYICGGLLLCRFIRSWRLSKSIENSFSKTSQVPPMWFATCDPLVNLPLPSRLHPFFLSLTGRRALHVGHGVFIEHVKYADEADIDPGSTPYLDIWSRDVKEGVGSRPVYFFIHGGGWRAGGKRMHAQAALLLNLAHRGWLVVCPDYGKKRWPLHISDCEAALEWVCRNADRLGADTNRVVIGGASAGGHIATLLVARVLARARRNVETSPECTLDRTSLLIPPETTVPTGVGFMALVLSYPAVDVCDESRSTAVFPFVCPPPLRISWLQSLLQWFFVRAVLGGNEALLTHANPLVGVRDLRTHHISKESEEIVTLHWPPTLCVHGELDGLVPVEHSKHLLSVISGRVDGEFRNVDALIEIPGAKHSYEVVGGSLTDASFLGIIGWLSPIESTLAGDIR